MTVEQLIYVALAMLLLLAIVGLSVKLTLGRRVKELEAELKRRDEPQVDAITTKRYGERDVG